MKIVYAGSPQYAVKPLVALIENGFDVCAVITQPDREVGRRRVLTPTPVKVCAEERGLSVFCFERISENLNAVKDLGADVMFTCAYGQILSKQILEVFPLGVYNLHASLLPKFRGASPIQSAILAGERYTGVTVMKTEPALDCGDILLVKRCEIAQKTYGELSEELSALSAEAVVEAARLIERGDASLLVQDEAEATFCKKIKKENARADFTKSGAYMARLINAYSPSPAAFCTLFGVTINLLKAEEAEGYGLPGEVLSADKNGIIVACGEGAVKILRLQFAGGKPISAADAVNGRKIKVGDRLD